MSLHGEFIMSGTASATARGALTIQGIHPNIILGAGTTFVAGSFTHSLYGQFENNGATFTATGSTFDFNGTVAQAIAGATSSTFNNKTTKKLKPEVETDIEISDFLNPYNNPNYKDDSTNQVVTNNVVQTVNGKLVFKTSIIDSGDPRIGCSASSKSLNFELVNNKQDYFELKDSELKTVNFSYIINGGLLYQIGNEPMRGTIKGQKLNGEWIIEINIYIEMQDVNFPEAKPIENHLVYKGIYK